MKPQPMSDPERNGRVSDLYDELAKAGEIGHHETLWHIVRLEVERAIAARDAQWAAMIGEPVAWERDGGSEWTNLPKEAAFWESLHKDEPDLWGKPAPLYAIKETP